MDARGANRADQRTPPTLNGPRRWAGGAFAWWWSQRVTLLAAALIAAGLGWVVDQSWPARYAATAEVYAPKWKPGTPLTDRAVLNVLKALAGEEAATEFQGIPREQLTRRFRERVTIVPAGTSAIRLRYESGTPQAKVVAQALQTELQGRFGEPPAATESASSIAWEREQRQLGQQLEAREQALVAAKREVVLAETGFAQPRGTPADWTARLNQARDRAGALEREVQRMREQLAHREAEQRDAARLRTARIAGLVRTDTQLQRLPPPLPTSITLALAIGIGLALTAASLSIRDRYDQRFRDADDLSWRMRLPHAGAVPMPRGPAATLGDVVCYAQPNSSAAGAYARLRETLASDTRAKRLVVSGLDAADGRMLLATNLAVSHAQRKRTTLLIDADFPQAELTRLLELKGARGLSRVLRDQRPIGEACADNLFHVGVDQIDVMPTGNWPGELSESLGSARFRQLLAWADTVYDQIVIVGPSMLSTPGVGVLGRMVSGTLVILQPDRHRRSDVQQALRAWRDLGATVLGFVTPQPEESRATKSPARRAA